MSHVLLFARSYANMAGGIEKMTLLIAQGLTQRGHRVVITSIDSADARSFYPWPISVHWEKIPIGDSKFKATTRERVSRAMILRKIVKSHQIDTVIGFQVGSFALLKLATLGMGLKVIAAERNAPTLFRFIRRGAYKRFFSNLILLTSSKIAIQFSNYKLFYPWYLRSRIVITPNPVIQPLKIKDANILQNGTWELLFVGRLTFQKNLQVLIKALEHLDGSVHLTVIGEGPDFEDCQKLAVDLQVSVTFLPPTRELSIHYLNSNFLVLPSRWEGFPNVVAEALSYGLPVIGYESCPGIPELITTGINGYVCPGIMNAKNLSDGISNAMKLSFNSTGISKTVSNYTVNNFIDSWEKVL